MTPIINKTIRGDAIRAYAIIVMVIFHSTGAYFLPLSNKADNHSWWLIANFIRTSTSYCVPLFVMLSGMLLLGKIESLSLFFRKRFLKIIPPFIAWIFLHFIYLIYIEGNIYSAEEIIKLTLKGSVYSHLWFLYMLIGLYLATPILRIFCKNSDSQTLLYFILIWAIGVGVIPIIEKIYVCEINTRMVVTTSYVGYFVAGYYFKNLILTSKQISVAFCGLAALIVFTALAVDKFSTPGPIKEITFFTETTRINIIIISFLTFLILKSIDYSKHSFPFLEEIILYLSKTSFGVYLVHYVIMTNLRNGSLGFTIYRLGGEVLHPIPGIFMIFIVTMLISLLVVSILQHIPYVKKIVP